MIFYSCSKQPSNVLSGRYLFVAENGQNMIFERNDKYQLEYSLDGKIKELFKITWVNDTVYSLESTIKTDTLDYHNLLVRIDSVKFENVFLTSYMEGIDFSVSSRITRMDRKSGKELEKAIEEYESQ